jgi:hypothetical protein
MTGVDNGAGPENGENGEHESSAGLLGDRAGKVREHQYFKDLNVGFGW